MRTNRVWVVSKVPGAVAVTCGLIAGYREDAHGVVKSLRSMLSVQAEGTDAKSFTGAAGAVVGNATLISAQDSEC